jgi:DNA (cytosine-5)-methyltransferase 1
MAILLDTAVVRRTVLSLFSGAGGMDAGLEAAGFEPIACVELDKMARETLRQNRPSWNLWGSGDVHQAASSLKPSEVGLKPGELDLIAGGPPCQPFSTAAQWASGGRRGMADIRATTVHALVDLVEAFLPRAVLIENVQGFIEGSNSAAPYLRKQFERINADHGTQYELDWNLVNAADFGVPQNRKRVIVVAFREPGAWTWPEKTHEGNPVTAGEALLDVVNTRVPVAQGKWAGLLPSIPEGQNYQWLTSKGGGEEVFGYRTKYWNFLLKLSQHLPAWTLPASPGPSTGPFHWENRPLSPAESMRLQTFPTDWALAGDSRSQTKLAGNATPSLLAEVFGRQIRSQAFGEDVVTEMPLLEVPRSTVAFRTTGTVAVPANYRHLVGTKDSHPGTGKGPAPRSAEEIEGQASTVG